MNEMRVIRESSVNDIAGIRALYPVAFPDEDLLPLVTKLLSCDHPVLSLVGSLEGVIAGHVAFSSCVVGDYQGTVSLLGPLAVTPDYQRRGIGRALVEAGFQRLKEHDTRKVFVLGDPAYYSRLGFEPERLVKPPYDLPEAWRDAWQSRDLGSFQPALKGRLRVPAPWQDEALWLP